MTTKMNIYPRLLLRGLEVPIVLYVVYLIYEIIAVPLSRGGIPLSVIYMPVFACVLGGYLLYTIWKTEASQCQYYLVFGYTTMATHVLTSMFIEKVSGSYFFPLLIFIWGLLYCGIRTIIKNVFSVKNRPLSQNRFGIKLYFLLLSLLMYSSIVSFLFEITPKRKEIPVPELWICLVYLLVPVVITYLIYRLCTKMLLGKTGKTNGGK